MKQKINLKCFIKENRTDEKEMDLISIFFEGDGTISKVQCCDKGVTDILSNGWYTLEGEDLDYVSITGDISYPYKK